MLGRPVSAANSSAETHHQPDGWALIGLLAAGLGANSGAETHRQRDGLAPARPRSLWSRAVARATYVGLLRGINVGGKNIVRMADLRAAFEDAGYAAVGTYIQSGNVLFESDGPPAVLERDIETMLEDRFGLSLVVVVRSHRQLRNVVDRAPDGFGASPGNHHCDVIFLKAPLSSSQALQAVELRDGVDQAWPGAGVLYFSRLSERLSQSRMSRIVGTPHYQNMTIRNWRTTSKLLSLLDERRAR